MVTDTNSYWSRQDWTLGTTMWRLEEHKGALAFAQKCYIMHIMNAGHHAHCPCAMWKWHRRLSVLPEVPGPNCRHWSVAVLSEYHQAQLRSPTGHAGNEAAPALSRDTGKEIIQEVAAGTFLPGFLYPGTKHRGHVALRECHHLLLKVNQVVIPNPLLSRDSHFLGTPRKTSGSSQTCVWQLHDPSELRPKPASGMSWSSDSSRYLSFRDKTVTHWIFQSFPCEPSMLLS